MTPRSIDRDIPNILLSRQEAAASLGMSVSHFERYVQPHVACAYVGQLRQYRPKDLEAWTDKNVKTPQEEAA